MITDLLDTIMVSVPLRGNGYRKLLQNGVLMDLPTLRFRPLAG